MDLKRKIVIGIVVAIVIVTMYLLLNNKNFNIKPNEDVIHDKKPMNTMVDLNQVFEEIKKIDGFEQYRENVEDEEFSDEGNREEDKAEVNKENEFVAEEQIDFGKYKVLEKKAIVETTDTEVNEVWMVKLGDINQQEDVCRIFGNRVHKLREAFKDDATQIRIINQAVIKQEDGIVIMIISPNKMEIEKAIGNMME